MISNFIAHLQSSEYRGEKFSRPRRLAADAHQKRQDALRAAQLANMRRSTQQKPIDPP